MTAGAVRLGLRDVASAAADPLGRVTLTRRVMRAAGVVCGRCGRAGHFALDPACIGLRRESAAEASAMAAARAAAEVFVFRAGDYMSPSERHATDDDDGELASSARAAAAAGRRPRRREWGGGSVVSAAGSAAVDLVHVSRPRSHARGSPPWAPLDAGEHAAAAAASLRPQRAHARRPTATAPSLAPRLPPISPEQLLAATRERARLLRFSEGAGGADPHGGGGGRVQPPVPVSFLFKDASKSSLTIARMLREPSVTALMRLDSAIFRAGGRRVAAAAPSHRPVRTDVAGAGVGGSGRGGDAPRLPSLPAARVAALATPLTARRPSRLRGQDASAPATSRC